MATRFGNEGFSPKGDSRKPAFLLGGRELDSVLRSLTLYRCRVRDRVPRRVCPKPFGSLITCWAALLV
jgi:hypothetical protein